MSEADNKGAPEKPTDAAAAAPSEPTPAEKGPRAARAKTSQFNATLNAPAEDSGAPPTEVPPPDAAPVKEPATVASSPPAADRGEG